jgi:hypothetical protein
MFVRRYDGFDFFKVFKARADLDAAVQVKSVEVHHFLDIT